VKLNCERHPRTDDDQDRSRTEAQQTVARLPHASGIRSPLRRDLIAYGCPVCTAPMRQIGVSAESTADSNTAGYQNR
jgi:hypothetical protein